MSDALTDLHEISQWILSAALGLWIMARLYNTTLREGVPRYLQFIKAHPVKWAMGALVGIGISAFIIVSFHRAGWFPS